MTDHEITTVIEDGFIYDFVPNSYGYDSAGDSGQGVPVWYGSAEGDIEYPDLEDPLVETIWGQYIEEGAQPEEAEAWAVAAARKIRNAETFGADEDDNVMDDDYYNWSQPCDVCKTGTLTQYGDENDLWVSVECDTCDYAQDIKLKDAESDCPLCSEKIDYEEAYMEWPNSLCHACYDGIWAKRYDHAHSAETFEAPMASFPAGGHDVKDSKAKLRAKIGNFRMKKGVKPVYITYREGTSNKFHVFMETNKGNFNAYGRIGYTPKIFGPLSDAEYHRKMRSKMRKGYRKTSYSAEDVSLELDKPIKTGAGLAFGFILASTAAVAGATIFGLLVGVLSGGDHE